MKTSENKYLQSLYSCVIIYPLLIKYPAVSNGVFDPHGIRRVNHADLVYCLREDKGMKEIAKGVFDMQKNRENRNRTEKLTIKGTALHMCGR